MTDWQIVQINLFTMSQLGSQQVWSQVVRSLPAIVLGVSIVALDAVGYGIVLFPGNAYPRRFGSQFQVDGMRMFLLSTAIAQLIFSGFSGFKALSALMLVETIPFLHEICETIVANVTHDVAQLRATVIFAYGLTSVLCGLAFMFAGSLRFGNVVSWFPRPFLIGTIGGIGYFILQIAFEITTDRKFSFTMAFFRHIVESEELWKWVPALLSALLARFLMHFYDHAKVLSFICFMIPTAFYSLMFYMEMSLEEVRGKGWLPSLPDIRDEPLPFVRLWKTVTETSLHWPSILAVLPSIFSLILFAFLQLSVNVPALALSTRKDQFSVNGEMIAHGISNLISGLTLSVPNYLDYANSMLCIKANLRGRLSSFLIGAILLVIYAVGMDLVQYLPITMVGFLNFLLAISLFEESLIRKFNRTSHLEYAVILITLLLVIFAGFNYCTLFGVVLAVGLWLRNSVLYKLRRRSPPSCDMSVAFALGETTVKEISMPTKVLTFYTMHSLMESLAELGPVAKLRRRKTSWGSYMSVEQEDTAAMQFILLDMSNVEVVDNASLAELGKLVRVFRQRQVHMFLVGVTDAVKAYNQRTKVLRLSEPTDVCESDVDHVGCFEDMDAALQWFAS